MSVVGTLGRQGSAHDRKAAISMEIDYRSLELCSSSGSVPIAAAVHAFVVARTKSPDSSSRAFLPPTPDTAKVGAFGAVSCCRF